MTAQPVGATQVPLRRYQVTALERRQPGIALGGRLRRHILELVVRPHFGSIGHDANSTRLGLSIESLPVPSLKGRKRLLPSQRG
jgi:hypothetical protein